MGELVLNEFHHAACECPLSRRRIAPTLLTMAPRWWRRSVLHAGQVEQVNPTEWVALRDARQALGVRSVPWLNALVVGGYLTRAATKPGPWYTEDIGVTRRSLDKEVAWWRSASRGERAVRKAKLAGGLVVNGF
jgi:hypothetical protein